MSSGRSITRLSKLVIEGNKGHTLHIRSKYLVLLSEDTAATTVEAVTVQAPSTNQLSVILDVRVDGEKLTPTELLQRHENALIKAITAFLHAVRWIRSVLESADLMVLSQN